MRRRQVFVQAPKNDSKGKTMKRFCAWLVGLMVLGMATANADEFVSPDHVHVKDLSGFIGQWKGRKRNPPGGLPAGDLRMEVRWLSNKKYLEFKMTFEPDGMDQHINAVNLFVGQNMRTQKLHAWQLGSMIKAAESRRLPMESF